MLDDNKKELEDTQENYKVTCLRNAEVIAKIIESDVSVIEDVDELKKIAQTVEVDEIHIFNNKGKIFAGTHPEYYNYTFDSGEQMRFFKPMRICIRIRRNEKGKNRCKKGRVFKTLPLKLFYFKENFVFKCL